MKKIMNYDSVLHDIPDAPKFTKARRCGMIRPDRPRPLKLFYKSEDEANVIFTNRLVFENCELKLIRDSTALEHQFLLDSRAELTKRTNDGELNLTIKFFRGVPRKIRKKKTNKPGICQQKFIINILLKRARY